MTVGLTTVSPVFAIVCFPFRGLTSCVLRVVCSIQQTIQDTTGDIKFQKLPIYKTGLRRERERGGEGGGVGRDRQRQRQRERERDRQTDRRPETKTERERERERERAVVNLKCYIRPKACTRRQIEVQAIA